MYPEGPEMEDILVATAAPTQGVHFDERLGGRQHQCSRDAGRRSLQSIRKSLAWARSVMWRISALPCGEVAALSSSNRMDGMPSP
jgi:hypothetical protein